MAKEKKEYYDIQDIMDVLPHRWPFLLVDRVTEVSKEGGKGYKNVTMNDQFFLGHFPGAPVMPGVLIVEGMAQCAGFIIMKELELEAVNNNQEENVIYFMTINNVKFRRPVRPGDKLDYHIEITKFSGKRGKFHGSAYVDGQKACEADMTAMIVPKSQA